MLVGDKIKIVPTLEDKAGAAVTATVAYIHPKRRYYVAEYLGGTVRRCGRRSPSGTGRVNKNFPFLLYFIQSRGILASGKKYLSALPVTVGGWPS